MLAAVQVFCPLYELLPCRRYHTFLLSKVGNVARASENAGDNANATEETMNFCRF